MSKEPTTLELLFRRYPLIINLKQLAGIVNESPQTIRNKGSHFPIQPVTTPKQHRLYKLADAARYLDSLTAAPVQKTHRRGRPTKAEQLKRSLAQQAEGTQAQPLGPEGARTSGAEADRPLDDERAERESQGGRPRPSASRGRSPVVGAKRSTIQIGGRVSSPDPAGASVAKPMTAQAGTRRAKAIGRVGAPAQHPIWMVERSETTTPMGSASGVQPEQGRLRVQRKGAQRLGLGTEPPVLDRHRHGEHPACRIHSACQCGPDTSQALANTRRPTR